MSSGQSLYMYHLKADDRLDDKTITPKTRNNMMKLNKSVDKFLNS